MLAFDTETTGLFLQNGSTCFAIGAYDGTTFKSSEVFIHPEWRKRIKEFRKEPIREIFDEADWLVAHNAAFDFKALCEASIYDWDEPATPEFWQRVIDTQVLAHAACNLNQMSLDFLTQKYLGKGYEEDDRLIETVDKCRRLVRKLKPNWIIAEDKRRKQHSPFLGCGSGTKWNRMDFWLPRAVLAGIPASQRPELPDDLLGGVLRQYLRADCVNTYDLANALLPLVYERCGEQAESILNVNRDIQHVIWKMETKGLWVRLPELNKGIEACDEYIGVLTSTCQTLSGIDHITDTKLRELLFDRWNLRPPKQTKTGNSSVDASVILKLHNEERPGSKIHQFLGAYLALKKYEKKRTSLLSYKNNISGQSSNGGYMHPSFNMTGTATTRFSSSNPNAQNIAKAGNPYEDDAPDIAEWLAKSPSMRSVFGPAPGKWWVSADYSQLQLRIFAYLTDEQDMIAAFDRGWDAHDYVARRIFNVADSDKPTKAQRRIAKNVNFGFIFGASPKKIELTAGIPGLWDTVLALFPNAHTFIEQTKQTIAECGTVHTIGGYPLDLKDMLNIWTGRFEKAAHAGVNYLVQGAEGIIVKRAMRLCDDYLSQNYPEGRIVLQVHDELVFEMPAYFPKRHAFGLADCMMAAAKEYGMHAPVDPELITTRWDKSVSIIPF